MRTCCNEIRFFFAGPGNGFARIVRVDCRRTRRQRLMVSDLALRLASHPKRSNSGVSLSLAG